MYIYIYICFFFWFQCCTGYRYFGNWILGVGFFGGPGYRVMGVDVPRMLGFWILVRSFWEFLYSPCISTVSIYLFLFYLILHYPYITHVYIYIYIYTL